MKISVSRFFSKLYYQDRAREDLTRPNSNAKKPWSMAVEKQSDVAGFLKRLDDVGATVIRVDPTYGVTGRLSGFRIDYEHACELPKATSG
jgi:hypothetical protein